MRLRTRGHFICAAGLALTACFGGSGNKSNTAADGGWDGSAFYNGSDSGSDPATRQYEFAGQFRDADGVVVALQGDSVVVVALEGDAASSGLAVGDVLVKDAQRTGPQTWSGNAVVKDPTTGQQVTIAVNITVNSELSVKTTSGADVGSGFQRIPEGQYYDPELDNKDAGTPDAGSTEQDAGVVKPLVVTTDSFITLPSGIQVTFSADGGGEFLEVGLVVGEKGGPEPTIETNVGISKHTNPKVKGSYGLTSGGPTYCGKYLVRAYALEKGGRVVYGNELKFQQPVPVQDCNPLRALWQAEGNNPSFRGDPQNFVFQAIPESTSNTSWHNARQKGFVDSGTVFIRNIVDTTNNSSRTPWRGWSTWSGEVMWKESNSSMGVIGVEFHPCELTISDDEKTLNVWSDNPEAWFPADFDLLKVGTVLL
jgi:hypothetical protein